MERPKIKDFRTTRTINGFASAVFDSVAYEKAKDKYIEHLENMLKTIEKYLNNL